MPLISAVLLLAVLIVAASQTHKEETYPDMIGTFSGMADWYEFTTAPDQKQGDPSSLGSAIINYKQNTRLTLMEQTGPFVRGSEYYEDSSAPDGWKFVANLYGIITHEPSEQAGKEATTYRVRLSEWLNEDESEQRASVETIGAFMGRLQLTGSSNDSSSGGNSTMQLLLDYTGRTMGRDKFGAQHMVLTKK